MICISLFEIFPSDYPRKDNLRSEKYQRFYPTLQVWLAYSRQRTALFGNNSTFTFSQEEYLKKKEGNNIFPHVNISTVNWS